MAAVKRFFRRWHGTIAWWVSPLVMMVVITGGVLAFRGYLKTPEPEATGAAAGQILTLDEAVDHAQRHAGLSAQALEIYVATDPESTWCVVFDDEDDTEVYMAADGDLVEVLVPTAGFTSWMFWLHTMDFLGSFGPWVSGLLGLLMMWVVGSGMTVRLQARKR